MTEDATAEPHTPDSETATHENRDSSERGDHLDDLDDGIGCAEVWEYMSQKRDENTSDDGHETENSDEDTASPERPTSD